MSTTTEVTLGGVHVRGAWQSPADDTVRAELAVYTPSGQARIAPLTERELLSLQLDVANALLQLQAHRTLVERKERDRLAYLRDGRRA